MQSPQRSPIAMVSDFGTVDNYVGVIKGVVFSLAPKAAMIDLTHQIPPQNLIAAQFALDTALDYLPNGTVVLAVVDPGVGTPRRAIAIQTPNGYFVGPDNGIFCTALDRTPAIAAVELDNPTYWRSPHPSTTFHGRDIFAPVAAHLAIGVPLATLGTAIAPNTLVSLPRPAPIPTDTGWRGEIQYIDRFGNLITTIPGTAVAGKYWSVQVGFTTILSGRTYGVARSGELLALVGSHGWVEIAQNQGSGAITLGLTYGDRIRIQINSPTESAEGE